MRMKKMWQSRSGEQPFISNKNTVYTFKNNLN